MGQRREKEGGREGKGRKVELTLGEKVGIPRAVLAQIRHRRRKREIERRTLVLENKEEVDRERSEGRRGGGRRREKEGGCC